MVNAAIAKLGENIGIKRFSRFKVGEVTGNRPAANPDPGSSGFFYQSLFFQTPRKFKSILWGFSGASRGAA